MQYKNKKDSDWFFNYTVTGGAIHIFGWFFLVVAVGSGVLYFFLSGEAEGFSVTDLPLFRDKEFLVFQIIFTALGYLFVKLFVLVVALLIPGLIVFWLVNKGCSPNLGWIIVGLALAYEFYLSYDFPFNRAKHPEEYYVLLDDPSKRSELNFKEKVLCYVTDKITYDLILHERQSESVEDMPFTWMFYKPTFNLRKEDAKDTRRHERERQERLKKRNRFKYKQQLQQY